MDALDFDLGRILCSTDTLSFNPYLSVKWASIKQQQLMTYQNAFRVDNIETVYPYATAHHTNNFSGVGPRIGLHTTWDVCHNIAFFGDISGALLSGKTCITNIDTTSAVGNIAETGITIHSLVRNCRTTAQLMLGAQWEHCFCDHYVISFRAAYEAQWWPNQWNVQDSIASVGATTNGDLNLQGFTLGVGLQF